MAQNLNPVQVTLVNETFRPAIEKIIAISYYVEALVAELDNQQSPITSDTQILNDAIGGISPRTDAPQVQGVHLTQLRSVANNMAIQLDGPTRAALVSLAVRDVPTVSGATG